MSVRVIVQYIVVAAQYKDALMTSLSIRGSFMGLVGVAFVSAYMHGGQITAQRHGKR